MFRTPIVRAILAALLLVVAAPPTSLQRSTQTVVSATAAGSPQSAVLFPATPPPGPRAEQPSILADPPDAANDLLVKAENAQPGSTNWRITNYASLGEIQAYAGQASVNAGDALDFYVSTKVAGVLYRIDFYRMGWYGGAGARLMTSASGLAGKAQGYYTPATGLLGCTRCTYDAPTGLLDTNWLSGYRLQIPNTWLSGAYLAVLTDARGKQTYVPFVVRQDNRVSALLVKLSVNTYQAYNAWGGKSLYAYNSTGAKTVGGSPAAVKVSFNRPYDADDGSGQFLRYEYNLVRWLERMGYDVSYIADPDLAANGPALLHHRGFISAGHDEYWTADERGHVEQALDHGVALAFLSGDTVYWQARYEPSAAGGANRTLVEYRGSSDPLMAIDPAHATVRWQDPPVRKPESALTGTIYAGQAEPFTQDWVVQDTNSWLFNGTGLKAGDRVPRLVGKEFDRAAPDGSGPPGLSVLSHSPIHVPAEDRPPDIAYAETTIYTAASGAIVFSAGDVIWSWGLDDASFPLGALHNTPVSPAIQRMTQNLLDAIGYGTVAAP